MYRGHVSKGVIDLITKMLTVSQTERWTARQLLEHPWILADSAELSNKSLDASVLAMRKYNIRRKFKAAADAVIISNRIGRSIFRSNLIDKEVVKQADSVNMDDLADNTLDSIVKNDES